MDKQQVVRTQDNVHDGTILVTQEGRDGAFVTVLGRHDFDSIVSGQPTIVAFDVEDLKCLHDIYLRIVGGGDS